MSTRELIADYTETVMDTFGAPQLALTRGEGAYVWDVEGNRYLDLLSGIAVNCLGHSHPELAAAIADQAATLMHVSNFFTTPQQVEAARAILHRVCVGEAPAGSRVFFANSGTEANEAALKCVRKHAGPTKPRILALTHAFHGRSTGSLSLTWKAAYREPFAPLMPGVEFIEPSVEALTQAMGDDVGGVFIEPIQGEAGVHPVSSDFARAVRDLTREAGAFFVVDEVQTGVGRTGRWMAHHAWTTAAGEPVVPDIVTLAKGLGAGFPVGACVGLGEAGQVFTPGTHGTTFGGNPLAARVVCETLRLLDEGDVLAHADEVGTWFRARLAELGPDVVTEVRGQGLLIAVDLAEAEAPAVVTELRERGIIANAPGPKTLRFAPPLIVTAADLAPVPAAVADACAKVGRA